MYIQHNRNGESGHIYNRLLTLHVDCQMMLTESKPSFWRFTSPTNIPIFFLRTLAIYFWEILCAVLSFFECCFDVASRVETISEPDLRQWKSRYYSPCLHEDFHLSVTVKTTNVEYSHDLILNDTFQYEKSHQTHLSEALKYSHVPIFLPLYSIVIFSREDMI